MPSDCRTCVRVMCACCVDAHVRCDRRWRLSARVEGLQVVFTRPQHTRAPPDKPSASAVRLLELNQNDQVGGYCTADLHVGTNSNKTRISSHNASRPYRRQNRSIDVAHAARGKVVRPFGQQLAPELLQLLQAEDINVN